MSPSTVMAQAWNSPTETCRKLPAGGALLPGSKWPPVDEVDHSAGFSQQLSAPSGQPTAQEKTSPTSAWTQTPSRAASGR
jgi:hypothetical protein